MSSVRGVRALSLGDPSCSSLDSSESVLDSFASSSSCPSSFSPCSGAITEGKEQTPSKEPPPYGRFLRLAFNYRTLELKQLEPKQVRILANSDSHVCLQLTPTLTSSSAGNSQGPLQVFPATVCKEEHPLLVSSFSVCKMVHPVDFQETVQRWLVLLAGPGHICTWGFLLH